MSNAHPLFAPDDASDGITAGQRSPVPINAMTDKPMLHQHTIRRWGAPIARQLCAITLLTLAGATQAADQDIERARYVGADEATAADTGSDPAETSGGFEPGRLEMVPYASAQYSRESNVFRFSNEVADVTGTRDTADRIQRYLAGLDTRYTWQQQKLIATVEGRTFDYDTYTHLDHDEHLLRLGYVGGFWDHTTALLNWSSERRMASFADRRSTELVIERERIMEAVWRSQ